MKWDMQKPCDNCPFLKKGGIRLTEGRVRELAQNILNDQGGTFPCHKTTVDSGDDECDLVATENSSHCAGALIFALRNGNMTQMMRIAQRLGMFKPDDLMAQKRVVSSVCADLSEFLEVNGFGRDDDFECCCVCDQDCEFPANYETFNITPFRLKNCWACGECVCKSCSKKRRRNKEPVIICNACLESGF